MKITGTRVDYGQKAGADVKDQRTEGQKQPSGVSGQTNAKKAVSKVQNESRVKTSDASPTTRGQK